MAFAYKLPTLAELNLAKRGEEFVLNGRAYVVAARFEGIDCVTHANDYMTCYSGIGILAETEHGVILANVNDRGRPVGR